MDIIRQILTAIQSFIVHPITRRVTVLVVVLTVAYGGWWYVMRYRPQTYLNAAYSSWSLFEAAVLDARVGNYQYDPYGKLAADLKEVYEQGARAKEKFSHLNPPTKSLREVQEKSLAVIDQYLSIQETIETDVKKEADYYYGLLGELKSFLENQNSAAVRIRINDQALARSDFYEETWREYRLLDTELSGLITKVQIASVPSRLKDFHVTLIQLLRDSQSIAANGSEAYESFTNAISEPKYFASGVSLGSLASRIATVELAPTNSGLSAADIARLASSPTAAAKQQLQDMLDRQVDVQKLASYLSFFMPAQEFFQKYGEAFTPPVLGLVSGGERLSDVTVRTKSYAANWTEYEKMTQDLENLIALGSASVPPSTALSFHVEMMGAFRAYLPIAREALRKFGEFNEVLAGDQFETLERYIARLKSIVASDLDFAQVWDLQDIVRSQANVGSDFDAVSRAWADELVRYRILQSGPVGEQ